MSNSFLAVEDLTVSFSNFTLNIPKFNLNGGEVVALVGSNGSGKTTFIEAILGLNSILKGDVHWNGSGFSQVKRDIGVQLQTAGYADNYFVEDIIRFNEKLYDKKNDSLKEKLGIDSLSKSKYSTLSRGQKQRVDLFMAFSHNPKSVYLDEPTTGLDASFKELFYSVFEDHISRDGSSAVIACHDKKEFAAANMVLWLENGNVKMFGEKHQMISSLLGDFKVEILNLAESEQGTNYLDSLKFPEREIKEAHIDSATITIYGSKKIRTKILELANSGIVEDYSVSKITEKDFLDFISRRK